MTLAPVLEVDLGPGVRAGFSTVALGNVGLAVGDDPAAVAGRRRAAEHWAGGPVAWARQVHGSAVHAPHEGGDEVAACDAMVSTGVGLAVVVADCVPVLLADADAGVVAVAHAGRSGLVAGVVEAAVLAAHEAGARSLRAVVGPAICGRCYEVPRSLQDEVETVHPGTASTTSWGTPALDLPAAVVRVLAEHDVVAGRLEVCTRTDRRFFSHRRHLATAEPPGRSAGVVRLR